jgi:hypothetical protein
MNRQVVDGMIIAAVLALGATHLYAQSAASRRVIRPESELRCSHEKITTKTQRHQADRGPEPRTNCNPPR